MDKSRLTPDEACDFMRELVALTKKYGVVIHRADEIALIVNEDRSGAQYLDLCGPQKAKRWSFSAPWGG